MKGIRHWIEIQVKRLDGIHVYDGKRKPGSSVRTLKKVSAIVSFSRNKRTESTEASLPLIPTGNEDTQNKDGSFVYIAKWNCRPDGFDDGKSMKSADSMTDEDHPETEPILLETNLHPKKRKKNRDLDEHAPFEAKDFEIFVGMKRQDEFIVFGASILTINAAVNRARIKLPLCPLGKPKQKASKGKSDSNVTDSPASKNASNSSRDDDVVDVEPIHFDNDSGRKFALGRDAHLTVSVSVADTATYCMRKMNDVSLRRGTPASSKNASRSRSMSPRRMQSERPPPNPYPKINIPRSNSMQGMKSRDVQFFDPSMDVEPYSNGYSFYGSHDMQHGADSFGLNMQTTFGDGISRISIPDGLATMNETFAETRDDDGIGDSFTIGDERGQYSGRTFEDGRSDLFSMDRRHNQHDEYEQNRSVMESVAVTKGPQTQLFEAIYGNVDDYTIATKENTVMNQGQDTGKLETFESRENFDFSPSETPSNNFDPLHSQALSYDQRTFGMDTIGEGAYTFDQSTIVPSAFNPGAFNQSTYNLGTFDHSTQAPGTIDQRSYGQGTFGQPQFDEPTYDRSSNYPVDGSYNGGGFGGPNEQRMIDQGTFDQTQVTYQNNQSTFDQTQGTYQSNHTNGERSMSQSKKRKEKEESTSESESESDYSDSSGSDDESSRSGSDSSSASSTVKPPEQIIRADSKGTLVREDITLDGASYARSLAERRGSSTKSFTSDSQKSRSHVNRHLVHMQQQMPFETRGPQNSYRSSH